MVGARYAFKTLKRQRLIIIDLSPRQFSTIINVQNRVRSQETVVSIPLETQMARLWRFVVSRGIVFTTTNYTHIHTMVFEYPDKTFVARVSHLQDGHTIPGRSRQNAKRSVGRRTTSDKWTPVGSSVPSSACFRRRKWNRPLRMFAHKPTRTIFPLGSDNVDVRIGFPFPLAFAALKHDSHSIVIIVELATSKWYPIDVSKVPSGPLNMQVRTEM